MKNACASCKYAKTKGRNYYCVKYGIVVYKQKTYCISREEDNSAKVPESEDGS